MQIPPKTRPRLFLIDAYALIYRAFFAFINRPLTNARGENTSAAFGVANFLESLRTEYEPDYLAIVFDAGDSGREEEYAEYKATREKMPDDLRASLEGIRRLVEAYNDPVVELDGFEADDVIGTLTVRAKEMGIESVIVSGDKDFYQLIDADVSLMNPGRGGPGGVSAEWVGLENADEKFGLPPSKVIDYLALIGDSADNVPGAPGIGPKTAVKLLEEYGTLEALIEAGPDLSGKKAREAMTDHVEQVRMSKRLVTIMRDLDVDVDFEDLRVREPDYAALRDLFVDFEFRRLADKYTALALDTDSIESETAAEADYDVVRDPARLAEIAAAAREAGRVALRVAASHDDPMRARMIGLGVSVGSGDAYYLPFGHRAPGGLELDFGDGAGDDVPNLDGPGSTAFAPIRDLLADPSVRKIGHDLKRDLVVLSRAGVEVRGALFDTMIASYVLDPGRKSHGLPELATAILTYRMASEEEVVGKGRTRTAFAEVPLEDAGRWVCEQVDCAERLETAFATELGDSTLRTLFDTIEMPLVPVLARMERDGIAIDGDFFAVMHDRLTEELTHLREDIHKAAGEEFNLNSPVQLREILFEKLDLPVLKKTKTGPSTDASVLEELATLGHDVPRLMLEFRELEKLRSTYVDALPKLVHPDTGRIHTSFNQTVAATGRLSSSEPNLQNIPIRTELGREVRKGFVAKPGHRLLGADYSQIELRVLAHFSGDDAFVHAFRNGIDVHRQTASVIFDVPVDEVTGAQRGSAKTINFATLYGQSAFSLAKQLGISREEAQAFIDQYFERFSGVRSFLDAQIEKAKSDGWVETLLGRRRFIPELQSSNWNIRSFGERVAQNTPIQGTAADMIKVAMIDVAQALADLDTGARMLLQVHDELLFEVPEDEVDALAAVVVEKMEGAVELEVPLVVEWGAGPSWYDAKG